MFPTGGKKRGCAFDNPEPSSPKVTCIGQVRVKTKKQGKKMRARSQKRRSNSEASFRKSESGVQSQMNGNEQQFLTKQSSHHQHLLRQNSTSNGGNGFQQDCLSHRNQRWVHLPFTICEALRAFGAELNCFLPCHSSCTSGRESNSKESKAAESESSCGTVFARWLVAVQDGDGKGREIELVVGDEDTRTEKENGSQRRHVFEGLDFKEENEVVEVEKSRISICIPPKNALLLMRSRSDPVRMAELAKRFCDSPASKVEEEDEEEEEEDEDIEEKHRKTEAKIDVSVPVLSTVTVSNEDKDKEEEEETKMELNMKLENNEEMSEDSVSDAEKELVNLLLQEEEEDDINGEETLEMATENEIDEQELDTSVENHQSQEEQVEEDEEDEEDKIDQDIQQEKLVEETMAIPISIPIPIQTHCEPEMAEDAEKLESSEQDESKLLHENEQDYNIEEDEDQREELEEKEEEEEDGENGGNPNSPSISVETERISDETETEVEEEESRVRSTEEVKETTAKATDEGNISQCDGGMGPEEDQSNERGIPPPLPEPERETETKTETKPERESSMLPDCLLLMMYEPKLSMEVSKETWVCSTDFIRCVPTREKKAAGRDPPPPPPPKKRESKPAENTQTAVVQPARWSCSYPAAAAAAAMIEKKLVRAKGYEPFVLTRCKSEPVRSSAKLAPEPCFWKDRKIEPHRPATFGVGAAGVGF